MTVKVSFGPAVSIFVSNLAGRGQECFGREGQILAKALEFLAQLEDGLTQKGTLLFFRERFHQVMASQFMTADAQAQGSLLQEAEALLVQAKADGRGNLALQGF